MWLISASAGTSFRYFARCPSNAGDISPDRKRRSRSVRQPRKSSYAASSKRKHGRQVELASALEDLLRPLPRRSVGVFINVAPFRHRIGPAHQTESLNRPSPAGTSPVGAADVFADARRLGIA